MKKIVKRVSRGKKGISIVIATVILVAVAITVAVSVAFWMGSIAGQYTRFEKLQVLDPSISKNNTNWSLAFEVKNIGSTDATVDNILINGLSYTNNNFNATVSPSLPQSLSSGESTTITLSIPINNSTLTAGTTIEVKFHTVAGMEYPKMVTLP